MSTVPTPMPAGELHSMRTGDSRQLRHLSQPVILEEVGPPRMVRAMLLLMSLTVFAFIGWASVTTLQETTKASGEVVPSGSVMAVQHLEGGIVGKIYVRDGDLVKKGDVLIRLDPTSALAQLDEMQARSATLEIRAERLKAFTEDRPPDFSDIPARYQELAKGERALHMQQVNAMKREVTVLRSQVRQRTSDLGVLKRQVAKLTDRVRILDEQKSVRERLAKRGLVSRMVVLQSLDQYRTASGELEEAKEKINTARNAIEEAQGKIEQLTATRRNDALDEAGKVSGELAGLREAMTRLRDRVQRLDIVAPVRGIVKGLVTNTVGGVIAPGAVVTEIVPVDEELVIEARVSPVDIGHVSVGQKATVKVTTFDYARFGSIEGTVRKLSATTFKDRENEVYYKAEIHLAKNHVGEDPRKNLVLPGMVAEIDINTGERTILRYLLRPVFQSLDVAFTER